MQQRINLFNTENEALLQPKGFYWNAVLKFNTNLEAMEQLLLLAGASTAAATLPKNEKKSRLAALATRILKAALAYASTVPGVDIKGEFAFPPSFLAAKNGDFLTSQSLRIKEIIGPLVTGTPNKLAAFGIAPADIAQLSTLTIEFAPLIGSPAQKRKQVNAAKKEFIALANANMNLLRENMDGAMEVIAYELPDVAQLYKAVRRVRKAAHRQLSYNIEVVDAATGLPLKGAEVTFSAPWKLKKKTKAKGGIKGFLKEGEGSFEVALQGYASQMIPLFINKHNTFSVRVGMSGEVDKVGG